MKLCMLLVATALWASAKTVVVSPASMGNWETTTSDPLASVSFVTGPATPPIGLGSAQFVIPADGAHFFRLRNPINFIGTLLSSVTALSYPTYQQNYTNGQAATLSFILSNGDFLFFEPVYQTGLYSGDVVPNQCPGITFCAALNQWQTWDALAGGWWDNNGFNGSNSGPPLFTLASFIAANSSLTITSVRIKAGDGAGAWDNFVGAADNFTIGIDGVSTTYNFEGVPEPSAFALGAAGLAAFAFDPRRVGASFRRR